MISAVSKIADRFILQVPEIVFIPSMNPAATNGFLAIMDNLVADVYGQASCIPRIASFRGQPNYLVSEIDKHIP
jgi:hypothetical protein